MTENQRERGAVPDGWIVDRDSTGAIYVAAGRGWRPGVWIYPDGGQDERMLWSFLDELLDCSPTEIKADGVDDDLVVWRATLPDGEQCHFGTEAMAKAWGRSSSKIERVELKAPPALEAVTATPSEHPADLQQRCRELEVLLAEVTGQRDFLDRQQSDECFRREKAERERDALGAELIDLRSSMAFRTSLIGRIEAENGELRNEVERLARCLRRANEQAERFEREWYLRGDEAEALRRDAERYRWLRENSMLATTLGRKDVAINDRAIDAAMERNQ